MVPRILVADDDPRICRALQRVLTRRGFDVAIAHDAASAISALGASGPEPPIAAMVVDWKLGPDDGLAILRAAREMAPAPHVLFMTGYSAEHIQDVALALGASAFFEKPIRGAEIARKLRSLLGMGATHFSTSDENTAIGFTPQSLTGVHPLADTADYVRAARRPSEAGTIVLVDSDPSDLVATQATLGASGHRVVPFLDPFDAIEFLKREETDLLVCDAAPSGLEGMAVVDAVRRDDPDIACVLTTETPTYEGVKACMAHGIMRYLEKPVTPSILREAADAGVRSTRHARRHRVLLEEVGVGRTPHSEEFPTVDQLFDRALLNLHAVAHPVVVAQSPEMILGYLLEYRTDVPAMRTEVAIRMTAERTGRGNEMRRRMLEVAGTIMRTILPQQLIFLRTLPEDFGDNETFGPHGLMRGQEERFVFRLGGPKPLRYASGAFSTILSLRERGVRFSVEYSGCEASRRDEETAQLLGADFVCLSPSLVTEDDLFPRSQGILVETIESFQRHGAQVVATGITTPAEAVAMRRIGCAMLSGPIFDAPGRERA